MGEESLVWKHALQASHPSHCRQRGGGAEGGPAANWLVRWAFPNVLKRAVALLSSCREALEAEAQKVAQLAVNAEGSVNKYKKALEDWGADLAAAQVGCPVYSCAPLVGTLPGLKLPAWLHVVEGPASML